MFVIKTVRGNSLTKLSSHVIFARRESVRKCYQYYSRNRKEKKKHAEEVGGVNLGR